jgi:H+/Cl- antiporter ClcA
VTDQVSKTRHQHIGFGIIAAAILIGIINTLVFKAFEFLVNDGTNYVWNTVFNSDEHRWVVIPLASALSIGLSAVYQWTTRKRVSDSPKLDSLEIDPKAKPSLEGIGIIAIIGVVSLVAGASLGPEASLVMMSTGIGGWMAYKSRLNQFSELLILASAGALLVVFCGSVIPILMPLLILWQKKRLGFNSALVVTIAGLSAFGVLWLIDRNTPGYGSIPAVPGSFLIDALIAAGTGVCAAALGWALKKLIFWLAAHAKRIQQSMHWVVSACVFGLVLGILYWLGGQTIQFSGSVGSKLLIDHTPAYGLWALFVIVLTKLAATAWSLATGYQGGLVFPSILMGVAIGMIAENVLGVTSPGVIIGSIGGIFGAMTNPAIALIFMISILPIKLAGAAIAGILGAILGNKIIARLT